LQNTTKGKWLYELNSLIPRENTWKCSYCGATLQCVSGTPLEEGEFYCPNCGDKKTQETYIES